MFHMFSNMIRSPSLTPCFSWVFGSHEDQNRFNGFPHPAETVETVRAFTRSPINHWVGTRSTASAILRIKGSDAVERVPTGFVGRVAEGRVKGIPNNAGAWVNLVMVANWKSGLS